MNPKDVHPFLPGNSAPTRPLGAALPALARPAATSPWSPRPAAEVLALPTAAEVAAVTEQARERGHAEGLAETAALRDRLTELLDQLAAARAAIVAPTAAVIAEVAGCVVETYLEAADPGARFAPIVRAWLAVDPDHPATARVHPDGVAALTEVVGDAPLAIVGDPAVAPGALEIRGAALELSHDWRARLADLRAAIVAALTGAEA